MTYANRSMRGVIAGMLTLLLALPVLASEFKIDLRATLTGPAFNGVAPKGKAEFQAENGTKSLSVKVNNINLANGTPVGVFLNGVKIGSIVLRSQGGTLLLSTFAGQTVPNVTIGSKIAIRYGTLTLLSGTF